LFQIINHKETLSQLYENLNTLREREAKYGGNAPLDLLNQISDHQAAIALTEQAIRGELSETEWQEALKPLLLAVSSEQVVNITTVYQAPPPPLPPAEAQMRRDLNILLKNVETSWIKGVLEKSVHHTALLDLGKEVRVDAVDHPWEMIMERPGQVNQPLPVGSKISDIFTETPLLLILGEPGSGKTITLLELARELIARARNDPNFAQPVPVVFNLSTWTDKQQHLNDWLVYGSFFGLTVGLILGLPIGFIFGLRGSRQNLSNDIQPVEALRWSWSKAPKGGLIGGLFFGPGFGLLFGLCIGLLAGIIDGLNEGLSFGLKSGMSGTLIGGFLGGLMGIFFYGLSREIRETKTVPNQGIRLSARNALLGGLMGGLVGGLIVGVPGRVNGRIAGRTACWTADYQNPHLFFERTYMTQSLTLLAGQVMRRLSGIKTETSAVFNMATQFGGGKTHSLTLLYHLAQHGAGANQWQGVPGLLEQAGIKSVPQAKTAVFVGQKFDPRGGDDGTSLRRTPWGEIAWQLRDEEGYKLFAPFDEAGNAPGGDTIGKLFRLVNQPALILMDELMNYISRYRKAGLGSQFYNFVQNLLSDEVKKE
jgi:hypothetical protein